MKTTGTGNITSATNSYSYPADFQAPIDLVITTDTYEKYVKPVGYEWFDAQYPDPSSLTAATPSIWVPLTSAAFLVGPAYPDATYAYRLRYIKEPTELTADADTLSIPDVFSEIMVLGMLARALMANDEYNKAQVIQQDRDLKLEQMKQRLLKRQFGESLRLSTGRGKPGWLTW